MALEMVDSISEARADERAALGACFIANAFRTSKRPFPLEDFLLPYGAHHALAEEEVSPEDEDAYFAAKAAAFNATIRAQDDGHDR